MDCLTAREQLWPFMDGALDAAVTGALERHLEGCGACAAELDEQRRITALLAPPCDPLAAARLARQVVDCVDALPRPAPAASEIHVAGWLARALWLPAVAAVALLFFDARDWLVTSAFSGQSWWAALGAPMARQAEAWAADMGWLLAVLARHTTVAIRLGASEMGGRAGLSTGAIELGTAVLLLVGAALVVAFVRNSEERVR